MNNNKIIQKDFIRELSIWQQEIEVEANCWILPKILGINCSEFFFSYVSGVCTAYRLKSEREKLPFDYIKLAGQKDFVKNIYNDGRRRIYLIKRVVNKLSKDKSKFNLAGLFFLRKELIGVWPAYLLGYNLMRYQQKSIFKPKNKIEEDNLEWGVKLHYYAEGIYDLVESLIGNILTPFLKKAGLKQDIWRRMTTNDIVRIIEFGLVRMNVDSNLVIDRIGVHPWSLINYLKFKNYKIETERVKKADIFSGISACPGKVVGRVKILSKNDLAKFKTFRTGEVLVVLSASSIFSPIIKKSSAVITDCGGTVSHAAIISREMNKPCIVGTKIATQVLKDGDKVEVDADNGVVKKIN